MAKKSYSELLLDPRWQKKRLLILSRDKFTCTLCGDDRTTLAVHHEAYKCNPWSIADDKLKTVCAHCHDVIHSIPDYVITSIHKQQSIPLQCWEIVAYTTTYIVFLYMFFSKDNSQSKAEIITVFTNLKTAA